jgi:folate-binding protein YgfZ
MGSVTSMIQGRIAALTRRGVVSVSGEDAVTFLGGLVTNDVEALPEGGAGYGGLLAPQGKILFDFIVFRAGGAFLFDLPKDSVADFVKRLGFYKLRAKVAIAALPERQVAAAWGNKSPPQVDGLVAPDLRLPDLGYRLILPADATVEAAGYETADEAAYDAERIALGIPEGGIDFTYGDAFPHEADMDQLGGVAFDKGCYIGQEVVSRMEHRGTARRRLIQVRAASPIPPPGAEIVAGEKPVGIIASSSPEHTGLAIVRLDRAREALDAGVPILVRGMPIDLDIPAWAKFGWPSGAARD